jgi:hypothetical protein
MASATLVGPGSTVFTRARRWRRIVAFVVGICALPGACASTLVACTHASPEPDPQRGTETPSAAPPSAAPRAVVPLTAPSSAAPPPPTPAAVPATAPGGRPSQGSRGSGSSTSDPAAPEPIVVSIDALPAGAKIFLDGVALATNPYEAEHPRDTRLHSIRIEAPGYRPQSSRVAFSGPVHTHVELVPVTRSVQTASP